MSVAVASFAVFAASQVGTPGPANMALMATGARFGFARALPFVAGVALGKQLVIWPVGFGLMEMADRAPWIFETLKWASAAYIFWLAWRVARLRLATQASTDRAPGFLAGLVVHPLNPKAWAMIVAGFTGFVAPGTDPLLATATIGAILLVCQVLLHPMWTLAGDRIARTLAGTRAEPYLMYTLAALTVASVLFVLFGGGT
ncbi:MAG: LysE family translocator [Pseudomonadota bacterium]